MICAQQGLITSAWAGSNRAPSSEGHHYTGAIERGAWVDASNLQAGYRLLGDDGSWSVVTGVTIEDKPLQAYNLTVADYHTFFVKGSAEAGADAIWVHNDCIPKLNQFLKNKLKRIKNQLASGGNKGVSGVVSAADAEKLGKNFVGEGARLVVANGQRILISKDGLRQFRYPTQKQGINPNTNSPYSNTRFQANFQSRNEPSKSWENNVHLDVKK